MFFAVQDYAGFWRRMLVESVDLLGVGLLLAGLAVILPAVVDDNELSDAGLVVGGAAIGFWYFVIVKRSRYQTIGYRLGRVRIVDANGQLPSRRGLSVRLLFAVFGPFNFVFDIMWIPSDPAKQALRDKVAHTYVVRSDARPAGRARIVYRSYYIMGTAFVFQEIEPMESVPASSPGQQARTLGG